MESQGDEKQAEGAGLVVVTGGATSVGRATALAFAEAGRRVFVADRSEDAIAALIHPAITARRVDVMDEAAVASFFAEVRGSGPVEVLVNTVGLGGPRGLAEDLGYQDFMETIAGSAGATFLCCREVIPQMKARGRGAIINFSSSSTRTGLPGRTAYIAAKGALEAMTRNLARELGPFGVRINAILPGAIDNPRARCPDPRWCCRARREPRSLRAAPAALHLDAHAHCGRGSGRHRPVPRLPRRAPYHRAIAGRGWQRGMGGVGLRHA